jgi:ABC-type phosphate transport system substrate-binding protein
MSTHAAIGRRRAAALVLVTSAVALLGAIVPATPAGADGPTVTGGGASFPSVMISQWRSDVAKPPYNLNVNYSAAGSGFGRDKYLSGALDFGQSDIPFLEEELARVRSSPRAAFVYVPVAAGALAFTYNVAAGTTGSRIGNIKLTPREVCRLFTEPGIQWNDPAIAALNPGVALPARPVRPVVRQDRSGTSYVLSEYCISRAPEVWNAFRSFIGKGQYGQDQYLQQGRPISQWPTGYGSVQQAFSSDGIINSVLANPDTITYIETAYPKQKRLPVALVQNPAGAFTPPDPPNSTVALGYATGNGDGTFKLRYDGPDARAYFPSTYSYTIAQTTGFDPGKGRVLAAYLNYAVTAGQRRAEPLSYSRLSTELVNIALDAIQKIPGAPPRPTDLFGAPPPPKLNNDAPAAGSAAAAAAATAGAGGAPGAGASGPADASAADGAVVGDSSAQTTEELAGGAEVEGIAVDAEGNPVTAASGAQLAAAGGPAGPQNSDVLFTLLLGAAIAAAAVGLGSARRSGGPTRRIGGGS